MSLTNFTNGIKAPIIVGGSADMFSSSATVPNIFFVDYDNGADANDGLSPETAKKTIQAAIDINALDNTVIYIKNRDMAAGATDPSDYAETLIIPATKSKCQLIGVSSNRTQGGLPQIKKGSGSTALLEIKAPGCTIANLCFNGAGATGGGILLTDNGSTSSAFGTTIINCYFKNCKGSTATNAATGGAIQWGTNGGAWQSRIIGCRFYKNVGDIVLLGTGASVPQDVIIEDNIFSGPATSVDCNLYLAGGSGMSDVHIRNNVFTAFPNLSSGTNATFAVLTGCSGTMTGNSFGSNNKTFGASANVLIPTTVLMANNYQEKSTSGSGEIFRT